MHTSDLKRLTGAYSDRNDTVEPNVRRGQEKPQFAPGAAMYDVFGRKDAKFPFRFDQRAGPFLHTKMAGLVLTDDPDYALQERVNKRRVLSLFDCGENAMLWHLQFTVPFPIFSNCSRTASSSGCVHRSVISGYCSAENGSNPARIHPFFPKLSQSGSHPTPHPRTRCENRV